MKVYSPSSTKSFLTCPFYWVLNKQGWNSKSYGKKDLYAVRGNAVSVALDLYNRGGSAKESLELAENFVYDEWEKLQIDNRTWDTLKSPPIPQGELARQAVLLVDTYMGNPPTHFRVVESEYIFTNWGNSRADVIAQLGNGKIVPVDYKCKDKPTSPYYEGLVRSDFAHDWQLMHYCHAISQDFDVRCVEYGIVILWYAKRPRITYEPFHVGQERMDEWYRSAKIVWGLMESIETGEIGAWEVADHRNKFGPCQYTEACLKHGRDPQLMQMDYFVRERT